MKTRFISSTLAIAFAMTATPVMAEEAEAPAETEEYVEEEEDNKYCFFHWLVYFPTTTNVG